MDTLHKTRIMIVDDHPLVREGIAHALMRDGDMDVCGETDGIADTKKQLDYFNPDLMIVDISLNDGNGLDLLEYLTRERPHMPVVVVTMHDEPMYVEKAFKLGAKGYFSKRESIRNLNRAVRNVMEGEMYVSKFAAESVFQAMNSEKEPLLVEPRDLLSKREMEIFMLLGEGKRRYQIADELSMSVKTVGTHFERMKNKLELNSAGDLTQFAIQWTRSNATSVPIPKE